MWKQGHWRKESQRTNVHMVKSKIKIQVIERSRGNWNKNQQEITLSDSGFITGH